MEENVLGDRVLAADSAEDRARLLGVQAQVVDEVAFNCIHPRLISSRAIYPLGLSGQANAVLADVAHFIGLEGGGYGGGCGGGCGGGGGGGVCVCVCVYVYVYVYVSALTMTLACLL